MNANPAKDTMRINIPVRHVRPEHIPPADNRLAKHATKERIPTPVRQVVIHVQRISLTPLVQNVRVPAPAIAHSLNVIPVMFSVQTATIKPLVTRHQQEQVRVR